MRILLPCLLIAGTLASCWAQPAPGAQPGPGPQPALTPRSLGTLRGRVASDVTNEPIKDARLTVRLGGTGTSIHSTTNAEGVFQILDLEPGNYSLTAERPNFVTANYGARRATQPGVQVAITAGQTTAGIEIRMQPEGTITGRVVDTDGDSLQCGISAYRITYEKGQKRLTTVASRTSSTTSSDLGDYRRFGLTPGRYYVSATCNGASELLRFAANPTPDVATLPTFFPNTVDVRNATVVEVRPGRATPNINIVMGSTKGVKISGALIDQSGLTGATPSATISPVLGGPPGFPTSRSGNTFTTYAAFPGTYWLAGFSNTNVGPTLLTRQKIEIGASPIINLSVTLLPPVTVTGKVTLEGNSRLNLTGLRVALELQESIANSAATPAPVLVGPDGAFRIDRAGRADFELRMLGLPEGLYIKSATSGENNIWDDGLHIQGAVDPIQVVLAQGTTRVEGSVKDAQGSLIGSASVILVPTGENRRRRSEQYRSANTDAKGLFVLTNVPPGSYKLFAWDDIEEGAWMDPEVLGPVEAKGTPVTVVSGTPVQTNLVVIE